MYSTCTYCKIFRLGMNYRTAIQDSHGYTMNASSLDAGILSSGTSRIANKTLLQETACYIKSHEVIIVLSVLSTYPGLGTKRKSRKIEGNWQLCDFLSEVEFWSCLVLSLQVVENHFSHAPKGKKRNDVFDLGELTWWFTGSNWNGPWAYYDGIYKEPSSQRNVTNFSWILSSTLLSWE